MTSVVFFFVSFHTKKELPHRKNRRGQLFCRNLYRRYGTHRRQEHTYLPKDGNVVLLELFNAGIGQGVVDHLLQHLERHGSNIGTGQSAIRDMDGVAHRSSDDLGMDVGVIAEHLGNGLDQVDAGLADIVPDAPERG